MSSKIKRNLFWIIYLAWCCGVLWSNWNSNIFAFNQPAFLGKIMVWVTFFGFSAYTIHCSMTEHFMKSLRKILVFKWGKQIGTDLVIGLLVFTLFVFWHSGSLLTAFLWLIPFICFGNLASLLYVLVHYEDLVGLLSR